jgi:hypothetical protein
MKNAISNKVALKLAIKIEIDKNLSICVLTSGR